MISSILVPAFLCILTASIPAQRPWPVDLGTKIDAIAQKVLARPVAGISVAVAVDGKVRFARGYGKANLEHSVPVTPETVFHIDSISKNILAAAVLQLADQGKLALDDDVTKYVPEAPTQGRRVTVRQLLNHTSGLYSFTSLPDALVNERFDMTQTQVFDLFRNKPFDFEPGTRWRYDNSAFYLAGVVVERVTKQDYGIYVREHLFKPLGMETASLCDARMIVPHLASGYEVAKGDLVNASFLSWKLPWAAGAVCATATDLIKWETALDSGRVLSDVTLKLMRSQTQLANGVMIDYGLGTRLGSLNGRRVFGHTGSGGGFRAVLETFPDDHLTIVVLMNTGNGSDLPALMGAEIFRAATGSQMPTPLDLTVPTNELSAIANTRFDSDDGTVEQLEKNGKLCFRVPGSNFEGALLRRAENVYNVQDTNFEVRFVVRDGRAIWGQVYTGGLFMDAKYRVN
jgi:CubicO group peptidase (beta-lactamase class C family)